MTFSQPKVVRHKLIKISKDTYFIECNARFLFTLYTHMNFGTVLYATNMNASMTSQQQCINVRTLKLLSLVWKML